MAEKQKKGIWKKVINKTTVKIVAIVVIVAVVSVGISAKVFTDSKTTKLSFKDIGELATQEVCATKVIVTDKARELFGLKIPLTQTKKIYSYDVVIKAGIDFTKVKYDVDEKVKKIKVKIPKTKVLSCEVDWDSQKIYHEEESVFTDVKLEESNEAMAKMQKTAEEDAIANGLFERAEKNAEQVLKGHFAQAYNLKEYKIEFSVEK